MSTSTVLTAGAVLAGVAGIVTAYAAVVKARGEGNRDCEDRLKAARAEAEDYAQQLHRARMGDQ